MQVCLYPAKMFTGIWSMRQECIGCRECRQLKSLAEFIPAQWLWLSCPNQKRYKVKTHWLHGIMGCITALQFFGVFHPFHNVQATAAADSPGVSWSVHRIKLLLFYICRSQMLPWTFETLLFFCSGFVGRNREQTWKVQNVSWNFFLHCY